MSNNLLRSYISLFKTMVQICTDADYDNHIQNNFIELIDKDIVTGDDYDDLILETIKINPYQLHFIDNISQKHIETVLEIDESMISHIKNYEKDDNIIYTALLINSNCINFINPSRLNEEIINFCKLSNIEIPTYLLNRYKKLKLSKV